MGHEFTGKKHVLRQAAFECLSMEKYTFCISLKLLFQAFSLEKFRSLQDKLLLLDEAVAVYDGNVITAVSRTSHTNPKQKHCHDFRMTHISRNCLFILCLFTDPSHSHTLQVLIYLKRSLSKGEMFTDPVFAHQFLFIFKINQIFSRTSCFLSLLQKSSFES